MNLNKIYSIFTSSETLSRTDIDVYKKTSDENVKHRIEEKTFSSDFDLDALEGWEQSNWTSKNLKKLDKKFLHKGVFGKWIFTLVLASSGVLVSFLFFQRLPDNPSQPTVKKHKEKTTFWIEPSDILLPATIEGMKEIPKKEQILIATLQEDYHLHQHEINFPAEKSNKSINNLPVRPLESKKIEGTLSNHQIVAHEIYLHEIKLIDYRNYRVRPSIPSKQLILGGVPASLEDQNSKVTTDLDWKKIEIPYTEYLEKTIALFAKGNLKKALSRFDIILKTYPKDLNSNFYGGLCYFNLGQYTLASASFEKCLRSEFNNFNEEAEWYLAKSQWANGNQEEALKLFEKIKKEGGYYAPQAAAY
jgi:TolA-binding protein